MGRACHGRNPAVDGSRLKLPRCGLLARVGLLWWVGLGGNLTSERPISEWRPAKAKLGHPQPPSEGSWRYG